MNNTEISTVNDNCRQLDHMNPKLSDSLFSKDLAPHYMKLAGQLSSSEMVPKSFRNKPSDLFICWSMGYQIGIPPEQAMQCIAVINGKPSMWGDDMLALVMAHPDFIDIIEEPIMKDDVVFGYTCTIKRKGRSDKINKFDLNDAKKAGLLSKGGVWTQYPERMLKLRARGFSLRDAFPDALKGIKPREEVEDYIDAEYSVSKPSRTELLKQEINKEIKNVDAIYGIDSVDQHCAAFGEDSKDAECVPEATLEEKTAELHTQIKQLLYENAFTDERLAKALKFYEVHSIEELSFDAASDFILKLTK